VTSGAAPGRAADPVRTVFFGSGAFAVPAFEVVAAAPGLELVGVVTAPDRPAGRGKLLRPTPVALKARSTWAPLLQPTRLRDDEVIAEIAALRPELGVLADYGQIVPREILDLPRLGILNVHPSLLPRHRGATPVPATIASGDEHAGVTIIRMDDGIDTGPIVAQESWRLHGVENGPELEARAAADGATLLAGILEPWLAGELEPRPQGADSTLTRPFRRDHGRLDPVLSAVALERGVRARLGWPGSYLDTTLGRLLVHRASVATGDVDDVPGQLVREGRGLALATADGRLRLDEVQLPGGRAISGDELLRGHPEWAEARVGRQAKAGDGPTEKTPETAAAPS
jgi:methionyl-tRNA formyltransferase